MTLLILYRQDCDSLYLLLSAPLRTETYSPTTIVSKPIAWPRAVTCIMQSKPCSFFYLLWHRQRCFQVYQPIYTLTISIWIYALRPRTHCAISITAKWVGLKQGAIRRPGESNIENHLGNNPDRRDAWPLPLLVWRSCKATIETQTLRKVMETTRSCLHSREWSRIRSSRKSKTKWQLSKSVLWGFAAALWSYYRESARKPRTAVLCCTMPWDTSFSITCGQPCSERRSVIMWIISWRCQSFRRLKKKDGLWWDHPSHDRSTCPKGDKGRDRWQQNVKIILVTSNSQVAAPRTLP